jgi:hypothetical protein
MGNKQEEEIVSLCWDFTCSMHNICIYGKGNKRPENGCKPITVNNSNKVVNGKVN